MIGGRRALFCFALVLVGAGAWWGFNRSPHVRNAPPAVGPIVALGDSLTFGIGAGAEQGYVDRLQKLLRRPIINSGVPADTIADGARRLEADVLAHRPTIVIVCLGGNDLIQRLDPDRSFKTLADVVRRIQDRGAMVVLVGLRGLSPIGGVGARYKRLARETESLYVPDILNGILGRRDLMADQIHPNADGYRIMADRIAKALAPYVEGW